MLVIIDEPEELLENLVILRTYPRNIHVGICGNARLHFHLGPTGIERLFSTWPEYSGDGQYPISGGKEAYAGELWDRATEYGQARYRLLEHIISIVEAYIKEKPDA